MHKLGRHGGASLCQVALQTAQGSVGARLVDSLGDAAGGDKVAQVAVGRGGVGRRGQQVEALRHEGLLPAKQAGPMQRHGREGGQDVTDEPGAAALD
ncbi:hypothetical protein CDD82_3092 [Ophiocordyceps australis]|uniref:Uncharacterized protein n=1 Tax=Ophiocordyceps australis TaxID=1399860 RepID=A0A2C5XML7_9HYPO|nr:hypothetical protein CDD82_3092 [Ophiocordyceps australis]